mgnify:FL=1
MEGAGFIRSHSEKVELKNNIFLEDGDQLAENEKRDKRDNKAASPALNEDQFIMEDENGNKINLLKDFKGDINDPEAVEAALLEQMRLL